MHQFSVRGLLLVLVSMQLSKLPKRVATSPLLTFDSSDQFAY